jgi:glycine C-acetyltransferase
LADKYDGNVDECHAVGLLSNRKRNAEAKGVMGRVSLLEPWKASGAMGGYTTAKEEIIELLRQRSRPYLFSNSFSTCNCLSKVLNY